MCNEVSEIAQIHAICESREHAAHECPTIPIIKEILMNKLLEKELREQGKNRGIGSKSEEQSGLVRWSGDRSYARVVNEKGSCENDGVKEMISINPFSTFKDVFFVDSSKERSGFKREENENTMVLGKFRRDWIELQPHSIYGMKTKVDGDTLRLIDLTKVKVKVEMNPNMVLLALLEVIDGA
ncbi:hypothetical protein AAG906_007839 [Vitis piasezkii]